MFDSKLGIIGVGVMGQGILSCAIEKGYLSPKEVALFDVCQEKLESYKKEYIVCSSAQELIDRSEYVLFSIKPQHFDSLASSVKFNDNNTIISIMAGKNIESIRNKTGFTNGTARVMPNTPCKIGQGVCAVCFDNVSDNDKKEFILSLLKTCGEVVQIEEGVPGIFIRIAGISPPVIPPIYRPISR